MKANTKNILIGAVVLAAVLYFVYPTAFGREGFEEGPKEPEGQKIAGIVMGVIFGLVVFGGMIAAFNAGGSK